MISETRAADTAMKALDGMTSSANGRASVSKAVGDLTTANFIAEGGNLVDEQANRFLRRLIEQSQFLSTPGVSVLPMNAPARRVEGITFQDRIVSSLTEKIAPANCVRPDMDRQVLQTYEYGACAKLSYCALQDNIEGGREVRGNRIEDTIIDLMVERVVSDIEEILINGDTASGDPTLANFDGFLIAAGNSHDHLAAVMDKDLFKDTRLAFAARYLAAMQRQMIFVSPRVDLEWRDILAVRATDLGDEALAGRDHRNIDGRNNWSKRFGMYGIPDRILTHMPDDQILIADPRNAMIGFFRDIFIDWDKNILERCVEVMITFKMGFVWSDPLAVARGFNFTLPA